MKESKVKHELLDNIKEMAERRAFFATFTEAHYDEFSKRIYSYFASNPEFAKDLVQTVFMKAFTTDYKKLQVHANPRGWLYQTARWTALEMYKKSTRYREVCEKLSRGYNGTTEDKYDLGDSLLQRAVNARDSDKESRQMIVDYYMNELTLDEISEKMAKDKTVVKSKLYRIHQRLKKIFLNNPFLLLLFFHI